MQETTTDKKPNKVAPIALIIVALVLLFLWQKNNMKESSFCFDFQQNTQFGDRELANPVNSGIKVLKLTYYIPEVPALQMALGKEGFDIDTYETTGGGVYAAAFYGPSTRQAVTGFQTKYDMEPSGEVREGTIEKLNELYGCEDGQISSFPTDYSVSTTTIE